MFWHEFVLNVNLVLQEALKFLSPLCNAAADSVQYVLRYSD